ncbi:MAG TPA: hypothetical protein DHW34_05125 [Actinobacteria bacterium]|nr:hypothetical protein [Actinomycetota bacterium]
MRSPFTPARSLHAIQLSTRKARTSTLTAAVGMLCVVLGLPVVAAIPAAASSPAATSINSGLFGAQDPTYDAVYRQSEALLAYVATSRTPAQSAVQWLLDQQCDGGGWQAYRSDTSVPCASPDAANYSGPDSNSTALAVAALAALNEDSAADKGAAYLRSMQNSDGGMPWFAGGTSDTTSTALAAAALRTAGTTPATVTADSGSSLTDFLTSQQLDCDASASVRGALRYLPGDGTTPSDFATAPALIALADRALPIPATTLDDDQQALSCPGPASSSGRVAATADYLVTRLTDGKGALESQYSPGEPDWTNTRAAVIGLAASGHGKSVMPSALQALAGSQDSTITDDQGNDRPGVLAELIMAAVAAGVEVSSPSTPGTEVTPTGKRQRTQATDPTLDPAALMNRLDQTLTPEILPNNPDGSIADSQGSPSASTRARTKLADSGATSSTRPTAALGTTFVILGSLLVMASRRPRIVSAAEPELP